MDDTPSLVTAGKNGNVISTQVTSAQVIELRAKKQQGASVGSGRKVFLEGMASFKIFLQPDQH
jgi:hypothetical protein